ncbi:MAG: 4Fe-4S single cluster domain-containing protein [Eubacteriales bacterium]|jgi:anaerobic ribonucleoside-triphosphate reductase activating protein
MEQQLRLAGVIKESIVDGPGLRYVIFVQGCPHHCPGCHNPTTHPMEGGDIYPLSKVYDSICENPLISGVTFSGGEPFCQPEALAILGQLLRSKGLNIMTYTGYTLEKLLELRVQRPGIGDLLDTTDWLVDGPFLLEQRSLDLKFRGSRNQRIIDMAHFRATGEIREADLVGQYASEYVCPRTL